MGSLGMVVPVLNTVLSLMGPGSVLTRRRGRGFSLMPVIGKYMYIRTCMYTVYKKLTRFISLHVCERA